MGYGMALNLRSKLDKDQVLYICDTSEDAINRFKSETESLGPVEVVKNGAEAMKVAVRLSMKKLHRLAISALPADECTGHPLHNATKRCSSEISIPR